MFSVMASNYTMFAFHFISLFPLITCFVNMMYLQIIQQRESLQMPKLMKQKALQLACQLVRYGFTKIYHIAICYPYKIYSVKLPAAATVHFPGASNMNIV